MNELLCVLVTVLLVSCSGHNSVTRQPVPYVSRMLSDTSAAGYRLLHSFDDGDVSGVIAVIGSSEECILMSEKLMTGDDFDNVDGSARPDGLPDFAGETVTSFIDMPNTNPPTTTESALKDKLERAARTSWVNYGFHFGATNSNLQEIKNLSGQFAGIKVFMGSSTGNMLVDRQEALEKIFSIKGRPVLVHSEDEGTIKANLAAAKERFGEDIPFCLHPQIRSREACIKSTARALELAKRHGTRLHILHVSTSEEVDMIREAKKENPRITAETSPNYLWFCDKDYGAMGGKLKCNPSVKSASDRESLRQAVRNGIIDTIGTDHAPHLPEEKDRSYLSCPSGLPSIGQSISVLTTIFDKKEDLPLIARIFSENASRIFNIKDRGRLEPGSFADLTVIDPSETNTLKKEDIAYKCGWSPYEGAILKGRVKMTFLNGSIAARDGQTVPGATPFPLEFRKN